MDHFLRWVRAEWDRAAGYVLVALGAVLLVVGYLGVRRSPYVAEGLAFIISGGLGGLFLLGLGGILLLSADLQDEWRKLDRIEEILLRHESAGSGGPELEGSSGVEGRRAPSTGADEPAPSSGLLPAARHLLAGVPAPPPARFRRLIGAGVAGAAIVLVLLVAAWERAASSTDPAPAFRATALAGAALVLLAAVAGSAGLRVRRRMHGREALLLGSLAMADAGLAVRLQTPVEETGPERVLVVPGLHYYHRRGCAAVAGLDARTVDLAALPAGAEACGLCRTD